MLIIPKKIKIHKELNASIWGLIFVLFQLLVLGLAYGLSYKGYTESSDDDLHAVDIITVVGTIFILLMAILYWRIFYHGNLFGISFRNVCVRTHATEAILMYSSLYAFGIGLLLPLIRYIVSQEGGSKNLYPFYPLVFLSMLMGFSLYQIFKFSHRINEQKKSCVLL